MKNLMKRAITFTLALSMSISLFALPALAADEPAEGSQPASTQTTVDNGSTGNNANGSTGNNASENTGNNNASTSGNASGSDSEEQETGNDLSGSVRTQQSAEVSTSLGDPDHTDTHIPDMPEGYSVFVDEEGVYQLTYEIDENADARELTLDLSNVVDALGEYRNVTGSSTLEPGDSRVFKLWITSQSGHTYKYQDGSFVLSTPEMDESNIPEEEDDRVTAFDGQTLEEQYMYDGNATVTTKLPALRQALIDSGIPAADIDYNFVSSYDLRQFQKKYGDQVESIMLDYYGQLDGKSYDSFDQLIDESENAVSDLFQYTSGKAVTTVDLGQAACYDFFYNHVLRVVYGEELVDQATGERTGVTTTTKTIYSITDYDDGTAYSECYSAKDLGSYYVNAMRRYNLPEDTLVSIQDGRIIFGFATEDGEIATASNSAAFKATYTTTEAAYENDSWHTSEVSAISDSTIANYMDHDSSIWAAADAYFQNLLRNGITSAKDSWVSLKMAANIDGQLTGNAYMNTEWDWYNAITLEQMDGEFVLTKVDDETGETITSSEAEFQLWYLDDESTAMYCTYDEEANAYTFTPAQSTVKTHEGILDVTYAMLKDIVYYLQEQVAPEGYEKDTQVYVIMDQEAFANMTDEEVSALAEAVEAESVAWLADVGATMEDGRQGMEISFRNAKVTIVPDSGRDVPKPEKPSPEEPSPEEPSPEEPVNIVDNNVLMPELPVSEETVSIVDEDVPMADLPIETPEVEIADEAVPMAELPALDIPEAPVPMAEKPAVSDDHQTVVIADELVPMADTPRTGDETHTALWAGMSVLTLAGMTVLFLEEKRRAAQESSRS